MQESNSAQEFDALFRAHFSRVKHFIYMLLKSEEDAEDLAQDVFTKLWTKYDMWKDSGEGNGYIYTTARNVTLNFIKHKRLEEDFYDDQIQESLLKELFVSDDTLDPIYYRDVKLALKLGIAQLPERRRQVFEMSRFKKLNNPEIAAALGLSIRTVEHHIYLTLQELKKIVFILFFLHFV